MKVSFRLVACGLALLQTLVAGRAWPHYFQSEPFTRRDLSVDKVKAELGRLLSRSSTIFGPSDPRWGEATERYNTFTIPHIEIVVQPAKESDIPIIVKYCNRNSIDFMVVNRGHSFTSTVGSFKGAQIDMASLTSITIQPGGKSAWLQGGTHSAPVIETLWNRGYVAATGSCSCVGILGPGLGGGHGRLEGQYGLISDNFINLNVVLADGSMVRVNNTSYADLFWAMKGAGHNFGIVTSFELRIFPRKVDTWHYHNYVWTQDKLETVFQALNNFHNKGNTPVLMADNFGEYSVVRSISETEAVLGWSFVYAGPAAAAEKLLEPFNQIGAVFEQSGDLPYPQIASIQGTGLDNATCASGKPYVGTTVGLQEYNITAQRQIYDAFNARIAQYPELVREARVVHEGYSNKAVLAVDPASSAFPHRSDHHLLYHLVELVPGSTLVNEAKQWVNEVRDLWNAGQPGRKPSTYVNYASGGEPLESMYGYEPWRLQRLRALKAKYDPHNRFRFYNPIV